jgi:hypothetical protein
VGDLLGNAGNERAFASTVIKKAIPVRLVGYNQNGLRLIGSVPNDMDNKQYP